VWAGTELERIAGQKNILLQPQLATTGVLVEDHAPSFMKAADTERKKEERHHQDSCHSGPWLPLL